MTVAATSNDPEMIAEVERIQLRALEEGGFDPASFAKRTDALEFKPLRRMAMHGLVALLHLTGRTGLAQTLAHNLMYMADISAEAANLPASIRDVARRFPPPTSRYQREDDHYFLMEMRHTIISALTQLSDDVPLRALLETINHTILATAPIGRYNAEIRSGPSRDVFAVILDDEIGRVAVQMGLIFAALVDEKDGRLVLDSRLAVEKLSKGGTAISSYRSIVEGFVHHGSSMVAMLEIPRNAFAKKAMLTFAQLSVVFVIAHEFAHVHLGHLKSCMLEDENAEIAFAVAAEVDADLLAMEVTQCVCRYWGINPGLAAPAAAAVLSVYGSVYATIGRRCGHGGQVSATTLEAAIRLATSHPSPSDRLQHLLSPEEPAAVWAIHVVHKLHASLTDSHTARSPHARWTKLAKAFET